MGLELIRSEIEAQKDHILTTDATETTALTEGETDGGENVTKNTTTASLEKKPKQSRALVAQRQQTLQEFLDYVLDLTNDVSENSKSAVTILNDLLNYDKIERGAFLLEIGIVPIWNLVRKTTSNFDIQARNRRVKLNFSTDMNFFPGQSQSTSNSDSSDVQQQPQLLQQQDMKDPEQAQTPDLTRLNMIGDSMRIQQVIQNLVSNGLKFVKEEEGIIDVCVSYVPDGLPKAKPLLSKEGNPYCDSPRKGSVQISVADNGEGMTEEQLSELFREGVQFEAGRLQG